MQWERLWARWRATAILAAVLGASQLGLAAPLGIGGALPSVNYDAKASGESSRFAGASAILSDPLVTRSVANAMARVKGDEGPLMRGARDVTLYANMARAVVLVVTEDAIGSGSVLSADGR